MNSPQTTASELTAVADAIRDHDQFLLTTHENPDGDALGSLLAAKLALDQLGKDTVMVLHGDAPLPGEYAFMPLAELQRRWPDDVSEHVLLALDCANESRIVSDASSTGEVLRDLFRELDVELTPDIAEALYIALVTDTGRFQYTNTTPKALRLAAELVEAGADVHRVFQGVYESVEFAKLKLLARALVSRARRRSTRSRTSCGASFLPPRGLDPTGIVLVDKPAGPSSFALVAELRRRTGARTGHAGTLDPFATGLLLLLSGSATKLASCFVGLDKRYLTDVDLTARTSTGDPEGELLKRSEAPSRAELERRVARLRGEIELPVPATSAVKIGGERAYPPPPPGGRGARAPPGPR